MKLFTLFVTILLIALECHTRDDSKQPDIRVDLGPLMTLNIYYNQTKDNTQMRLAKTFADLEVTSKFSEEKMAFMKHSRYESLQLCDNLNLVAPENLPLIDCKSAVSHIVDSTYPEASYQPGNYVRLSSLRAKWKHLGFAGKRDVLLYPLRQTVTDEAIKSVATENELSNINFGSKNLSLGYYFESASNDASKSSMPIVCAGKLFLSVNRTSILGLLSDDPFPDEVSELSFLLQQGESNGFVIDVQDMNCHKPSSNLIKFSLDINLTIIKLQQFPYLTVNLDVTSRPIKQILNMNAKLNQVQDQDATSLHKYNTTISIRGSSFIIPSFNFNLDQIWVNQDKQTGYEQMVFVHPHFPIIVDALWNATSFIKSGRFFALDSAKEGTPLEKMDESVKLYYLDSKDNDHVTLGIDIKRDVLPALGMPLNFLENAIEKQLNDADAGVSYEIRDEL